jgi:SPX domain protein involved in polyphosphate accumulation
MGHAARYELKYLIQEPRAVAVADFISSYLRPSEHNSYSPVRGHPVISLYMDSPDFFFFRQAFTGHKNRMKLRIRFYDDEWKRPAFLEVKRRVSEVICKDRAMISREGVRQILSAGWPNQPYFPDTTHLTHGKRRQDVNADFWQFANSVRARGAIYVSYIREIWESPVEEELRVTFDREVTASRYDGSGELHVPKRGWRPFCFPPHMETLPKDFVVLELKFEERAPRWMLDLVKVFNLQQVPICKYSACVNTQQLQYGRPPLPELEEALNL